jgi:hypothetical protein
MKIDENLTRGFRNNNPMNIVKSKDQWLGKRTPSTDAKFEQFFEMKFGIRAALKILTRYHRDYGLVTVNGIIHRWAPDGGRVERNYISYVEGQMKQSLPDWDGIVKPKLMHLYELAKAMCWVESHYVLTETAFRMAVDLLPIDYRTHWFFKKDERR